MATTRQERMEMESTEPRLAAWERGVLGGLVGAFGFGLLLWAMAPGFLTDGIPAMYGFAGPAGIVGWIIHMSHGAVIGVVFAAIVQWAQRNERLGTATNVTLAGLAYGLVEWVVLAVIVLPIWLSAVGFPGAPAVPAINTTSFVGHVIYGLLLGGTYAALSRPQLQTRQVPEADEAETQMSDTETPSR